MSERAFLDAIIAEPDEDAHRLVFADWLDERGDSDRAEFIRTQCALARMAEDDPRRTDLEVRERRLLAANACEWADPWPRFGGAEYAGDEPLRAVFRRGFLEAIDVPAYAPNAPYWEGEFRQLFAAHPIRGLNFTGLSLGTLPLLAAREELRRVGSLSLFLQWYRPHERAQYEQLRRDVDAFLRSPRLTGLRSFQLYLWPLNDDQAAVWFALPGFGRLEAVRDPATLNPDGRSIRALARGAFPHLHELELSPSNEPSYQRAAEELIRSSLWPQVRSLSLPASETFPWATALATGQLGRLRVESAQSCRALLTALASTDGPLALEDLEVCCEGDNLSRLLESPALANLRRLNLHQTSLTDDDLELLARSPLLAQLSRLTIQARHGAEPGLTALFSSPHLGRLTRLEVNGGRLSASAAEALASNPNRGRLRTLRLPDLNHGRDPPLLAVLSGGEPFPELHTLRLRWWRPPPRPAIFREFLHSPKLPRLCVVEMDGVPDRDADALAAVIRDCDRIAWAGGEMGDGGDGVRIAIKPKTVYLPNHLDDF